MPQRVEEFGRQAHATPRADAWHARSYNEEAMHSPWRKGPTKMIGIGGGTIGCEEQIEYEIV
jgi:hypothetical protein